MTDEHLRESRRAAAMLGMVIGGLLVAAGVGLAGRAIADAPSIEHAAGGLLVAVLPAIVGLLLFVPARRKWRANR